MSKRNFRSKSKRQPHKRQLLKISEIKRKLEQELDEAFEIKKNNQLLNANLKRERDTAQEATRNAIKKEEQAARLRKFAEEELRSANKFHPSLLSSDYIDGDISPVSMSDALSYRLVAPHVDWDDQRQVGAIKMIIGKAPGQRGQVAYAISEGSIRYLTDNMFEEVAKDMGNRIAKELLQLAKTNIRK